MAHLMAAAFDLELFFVCVPRLSPRISVGEYVPLPNVQPSSHSFYQRLLDKREVPFTRYQPVSSSSNCQGEFGRPGALTRAGNSFFLSFSFMSYSRPPLHHALSWTCQEASLRAPLNLAHLSTMVQWYLALTAASLIFLSFWRSELRHGNGKMSAPARRLVCILYDLLDSCDLFLTSRYTLASLSLPLAFTRFIKTGYQRNFLRSNECTFLVNKI